MCSRACHGRSPQVSDSGDLLDRQFAEDGQHEILQKAVLEDIHFCRAEAFWQRAAAEDMLHWRSHLRAWAFPETVTLPQQPRKETLCNRREDCQGDSLSVLHH